MKGKMISHISGHFSTWEDLFFSYTSAVLDTEFRQSISAYLSRCTPRNLSQVKSDFFVLLLNEEGRCHSIGHFSALEDPLYLSPVFMFDLIWGGMLVHIPNATRNGSPLVDGAPDATLEGDLSLSRGNAMSDSLSRGNAMSEPLFLIGSAADMRSLPGKDPKRYTT